MSDFRWPDRRYWFGCVEREELHKHYEFDRESSRLRQEVQMNVIYEVNNQVITNGEFGHKLTLSGIDM